MPICAYLEGTVIFLSESSRNMDIGAFTEYAGGLNKVHIVDAMLVYDRKRTNRVYLLFWSRVHFSEGNIYCTTTVLM